MVILFDSWKLIAQDLACQMKAMHAVEKQWDTHASLVLRYILHDVCILLWLLQLGQDSKFLGPLILSTTLNIVSSFTTSSCLAQY